MRTLHRPVRAILFATTALFAATLSLAQNPTPAAPLPQPAAAVAVVAPPPPPPPCTPAADSSAHLYGNPQLLYNAETDVLAWYDVTDKRHPYTILTGYSPFTPPVTTRDFILLKICGLHYGAQPTAKITYQNLPDAAPELYTPTPLTAAQGAMTAEHAKSNPGVVNPTPPCKPLPDSAKAAIEQLMKPNGKLDAFLKALADYNNSSEAPLLQAFLDGTPSTTTFSKLIEIMTRLEASPSFPSPRLFQELSMRATQAAAEETYLDKAAATIGNGKKWLALVAAEKDFRKTAASYEDSTLEFRSENPPALCPGELQLLRRADMAIKDANDEASSFSAMNASLRRLQGDHRALLALFVKLNEVQQTATWEDVSLIDFPTTNALGTLPILIKEKASTLQSPAADASSTPGPPPTPAPTPDPKPDPKPPATAPNGFVDTSSMNARKVLMPRRKIAHFVATGGIFAVHEPTEAWSTQQLTTTITTTVAKTVTQTDSAGNTTVSNSADSTVTNGSEYLAYRSDAQRWHTGAALGLTWFPGGLDTTYYGHRVNGKISTLAFRKPHWNALGFFLGSTLNTTGLFTFGPAFELTPGVELMAGGTLINTQKLPLGITPCRGLGAALTGPPATTSTTDDTTYDPTTGFTTRTQSTTKTLTQSNCSNADATVLPGATLTPLTETHVGFTFGLVLNSNLLKALGIGKS